MAVAQDRSMNQELFEGFTDGSVRKPTTGSRGGVVERTSMDSKRNFLEVYGNGTVRPDAAEALARAVIIGR